MSNGEHRKQSKELELDSRARKGNVIRVRMGRAWAPKYQTMIESMYPLYREALDILVNEIPEETLALLIHEDIPGWIRDRVEARLSGRPLRHGNEGRALSEKATNNDEAADPEEP